MAPVAALVSTVLPVGIAVAGGERPTSRMVAGGLICLVAIVLVSAAARPAPGPGTIRTPAPAGCAAWATASRRGRGSACSSYA